MTKTSIQLEKQAEQAFQSLEPQIKTVVRGYLDRLKLGDSLIGEVPLDIMPGCFALWLPETKHVILFQRFLQKTFFGEILKIIVKLIDDKLEERLVREYFRSVCGIAAVEEESTQFDPTSAQPQRWVFIVKLILTLTAISTAFLVEFGPKLSLNDVFDHPNTKSIPERLSPIEMDTK
jgi:hypothetical protein